MSRFNPANGGGSLEKTLVSSTPSQSWSKIAEVVQTTINGEQRVIPGCPNYERKKIMVIGSSTAAGTGATGNNGWVSKLKTAVEAVGYTLLNRSISGNNTQAVIDRFYKDVVPESPDYLIISLTLINEGVIANGELAFNTYKSNILRLINMCKQHSIVPIVCSNYTHNDFTEAEYLLTKQINRYFDDAGVYQINFLGAVDDRTGKYIPGSNADTLHPNDLGHDAFFKAIPPTLFDNLQAWNGESPRPRGGAVLFGVDSGPRPIEAVFTNPLNSFTLSFKMRCTTAKSSVAVAGVGSGTSRIRILTDPPTLEYSPAVFTGMPAMTSDVSPHIDFKWHQVALTYNAISKEARFYVDGKFIGNAEETLELTTVTIGGRYDGMYNAENIEYSDVLIYRTRLNDRDIQDIYSGNYPKSSLEIFAPLSDVDFSVGKKLANLAPTSSYLKVNSSAFTPVQTNVSISDVLARNVSLIGGGQLFSEDGALKYRKPDGTVTTLVN